MRLQIKIKKNIREKEHSENLTGTKDSYKPSTISRSHKQKKYETWKG